VRTVGVRKVRRRSLRKKNTKTTINMAWAMELTDWVEQRMVALGMEVPGTDLEAILLEDLVTAVLAMEELVTEEPVVQVVTRLRAMEPLVMVDPAADMPHRNLTAATPERNLGMVVPDLAESVMLEG